jgi:hypothetical protein
MITIKSSPTADTRSSHGESVSMSQLMKSSKQHINDVQNAMEFFQGKLAKAAEKHDYTKIDSAGIREFHKSFSKGLKGDDFKAEPWFQRHISEERHHLNDRVPDDVNLIDVFERIADVVMAGLGRTGKVVPDILDPQILVKAYENTINLLAKNVKITYEE